MKADYLKPKSRGSSFPTLFPTYGAFFEKSTKVCIGKNREVI
jgi:hypothetical protein